MTNDALSAIMETPNSVLTAAPSKEETEMLRATEKSPRCIVGSAKETRWTASQTRSVIKKISCSNM